MNCPLCGWDSTVSRTVGGPRVTRRRECACGSRWTTTETTVKGSLVAPTGAKGVLSSLSDLRQSEPLSDPDLSSVVGTLEKPKNGRGDAFEYPAGFEELWSKCQNGGRGKGNKHPAYKAWLKSRPDPTTVSDAWNLWMSTPGWQAGFNKDVSTWLNARGWQDVPSAAEMTPRNGVKPAAETFAQRDERARREAADRAKAAARAAHEANQRAEAIAAEELAAYDRRKAGGA